MRLATYHYFKHTHTISHTHTYRLIDIHHRYKESFLYIDDIHTRIPTYPIRPPSPPTRRSGYLNISIDLELTGYLSHSYTPPPPQHPYTPPPPQHRALEHIDSPRTDPLPTRRARLRAMGNSYGHPDHYR